VRSKVEDDEVDGTGLAMVQARHCGVARERSRAGDGTAGVGPAARRVWPGSRRGPTTVWGRGGGRGESEWAVSE
jgi:hypothetical protein